MPLLMPTNDSAEVSSTEAPNSNAVTAALLQAIAVLEQESEVLAGRSSAPLIDVSMRKAHCINELAQTLRALTSEQQRAHAALLTHAQQLNDRNARMLAARLVSNRARLDALNQAALDPAGAVFYGADGRSHSPARAAGVVA